MVGERLSIKELAILDAQLKLGEVIFTHYGAGYAYFGEPGDNYGAESVQISRSQLIEMEIPVTNLTSFTPSSQAFRKMYQFRGEVPEITVSISRNIFGSCPGWARWRVLAGEVDVSLVGEETSNGFVAVQDYCLSPVNNKPAVVIVEHWDQIGDTPRVFSDSGIFLLVSDSKA